MLYWNILTYFHYSIKGGDMSNQIKKKKKNILIALLLVFFSLALTAGLVAAFYSDSIKQKTNLGSGTLKISGSYTYYLNGTETTYDNIKRLNPGDVIVIKGQISNTGNISGWIRDVISFEADPAILPYLNIYSGEFTKDDFDSETDFSQYLLSLTNGTAVSNNMVINGSGNNAETEGGGSYNYLNSSSYQIVYTIYFLPTAENETQDKTFSLSIVTQALQFRNNNKTEPDENAWSAAGLGQ